MPPANQQVEHAKKHLERGETVDAFVDCTTDQFGVEVEGVCIATDRRLVFYRKKWFGAFELQSYPYASISCFAQNKNMMGRYSIGFSAFGNMIALGRIRGDQISAFVTTSTARIDQKHAAVAAPSASSGPSIMDQIQQLAELQTAGVLTDEEFSAKKRELLDRL